jgi:phage antirepressor YoqD-like protein
MTGLQIYDYKGSKITFDKNGQIMVNATEMAKVFDKQPKDFIRLAQTEEFAKVLSARLNILPGELLTVRNGGNNFGTWMHQKLALKFAAWLSPDFELWVYDRIEELLTTGQTSLENLSKKQILEMALESEKEKERLQAVNELQSNELQKAAPKVLYHDEVLQAENCHTSTTIAKELGMSAKALNHELKVKGVHFFQDDHWVLYAKYQGLGYTKTRTHKYESIEGSNVISKTSISTVWTEKGREFIHSKIKS